MNILSQLEAGNVGTVISKLEQLFVEDVVDPAEPIIADAVKVVGAINQVLALVNGLVNSLTPATSGGETPVLVSQPTPPAAG